MVHYPTLQRQRTMESLLEGLIDNLFFSFPTDPKPPITLALLDQEDSLSWVDGEFNAKGITIQMAVAGYQKDDIKVYIEDNVLYIDGDNTSRDEVPEKFKSSFKRYFPVRKNLDLKKAEVSLEFGILTINIPLIEEEKRRKYLFGTRP